MHESSALTSLGLFFFISWTSTFYGARLLRVIGYCYALVSRIYKSTCEKTVLEIRTLLGQRSLFLYTTVNFEFLYFFNEETEDILTDRYLL